MTASVRAALMVPLLGAVVLFFGCRQEGGTRRQVVARVSDELRAEFQLAPFYQKSVVMGSFPIVGSANVSDAALLEAGWIVERILGDRGDILEAMADQKVRLVVMAWNEYTTDVPEAGSPLAGSWVMDEISVISQRGENSYPDPAPGLFVFGETYSSMVWMPLTEIPADFEVIWKPTDEEKAAAFNSIVVNSGTYTYTDSTVTTVPTVAKTPEFIDGYAIYTYSVVGDTLWMEMTDTVSRDGVRDPGVGLFRMPLKLVRAE